MFSKWHCAFFKVDDRIPPTDSSFFMKRKKPAETSGLLIESAEREESLKWMLLDMYNNVIPLFSTTLILIFTFYCLIFFNDVSRRGSRR